MTDPATPRETPPYLIDHAALDLFVAAWRAGTLPKPAWTHAAHVAVCAYHAWQDVPLDEVCAVMRAGILAYNEAVGTANTATSGYHETLTRFWAMVIVGHLAADQPASRFDAVRSTVAVFGEARSLHADYYRADVVRDPVARATWVPPDLVTTRDK